MKTKNQQTLLEVYKERVKQLDNEVNRLKNVIETLQPKGRSRQVAKLFLPRSQW